MLLEHEDIKTFTSCGSSVASAAQLRLEKCRLERFKGFSNVGTEWKQFHNLHILPLGNKD